MPNISWIDEENATGELAEVYASWFRANPGRKQIPFILKCFSHRPDFLKHLIDFIYPLQFKDGHLTRRVKEMIATFVSALNQCLY